MQHGSRHLKGKSAIIDFKAICLHFYKIKKKNDSSCNKTKTFGVPRSFSGNDYCAIIM